MNRGDELEKTGDEEGDKGVCWGNEGSEWEGAV